MHKCKYNSESKIISSQMSDVGYWFNEKKSKKFGAVELTEACRERGIFVNKIDIGKEIEGQGDFHIFLHKLTAIYGPAFSGDSKAKSILNRVEKYLEDNPHIILVDPLSSVKKLFLRFDTYLLLSKITENQDKVFVPNFACLHQADPSVNSELLQKARVTFPIVCKPLHAGGGKDAHELCLVFNESRLSDCVTPCVAQTFVKHNGVLFKIFVLGKLWFASVRPSLKNFFEGDKSTISFNSHHVSKPDSCSPLNHSDQTDCSTPRADLRILQRIARSVKDALDSDLLGIDVVIDVITGDYAVIDVNAFPSYDSIPYSISHIADLLRYRLDHGREKIVDPTFSLPLDIRQVNFLQNLNEIKIIEVGGGLVNLDDVGIYCKNKDFKSYEKIENGDVSSIANISNLDNNKICDVFDCDMRNGESILNNT